MPKFCGINVCGRSLLQNINLTHARIEQTENSVRVLNLDVNHQYYSEQERAQGYNDELGTFCCMSTYNHLHYCFHRVSGL